MLAVDRRNKSECPANGVSEDVRAADFPSAQDCLDLRPHFFNGIESGTVGRKRQDSHTRCFQSIPNSLHMVRAHAIHHHDVAWAKGRK